MGDKLCNEGDRKYTTVYERYTVVEIDSQRGESTYTAVHVNNTAG